MRTVASAFALALAAGVVITITACDDGGPVSVLAPGGTASRTGSVSANHGHVATISGADLTAGNAVTLNIGGSADHTHTVDFTAAEVVQIRSGQQVAKMSSTDISPMFGTHFHTVTFN